MNMNKALQNLYHAVSNETTTKVNISKLLVDIHYAITGKESENKNNWSKIVNSMADNWPEGGGGSSDFSTAEVTIVDSVKRNILLPFIVDDDGQELHSIVNLGISENGSYTVPLYKGSLTGIINEGPGSVSVSGYITHLPNGIVIITGDCTITIS